MYRGLLFMTVIYSATGFNIQHSPVKHFTNDDPLFGQNAIQSTNGLVIYEMHLFICVFFSFKMCNQVCIKKSVTEDLNGDCKLMGNPTGKVELNHAELVNNNNNNNNNHYQGRWTGQDAGTEIAFVLDGSGSIDHDDFQRAKDFIYNVMFNVWKTCFNCDFAIVQYGQEIRTELSLLDSKDPARALLKVKEIQQLGKLTMTASAIHHVLTDIFIPENGSKKNSKKIIIVLSDGKILGDPMKLTDVLNMPQMKGVTRYSIGVSVLFTDYYTSILDNKSHFKDAGTEIAFVLDGSGSITPDDFQRAKDFIYNVMSNVWKTCFNATILFLSTKNKLSLLFSVTLQYTDIFIPENGSKKNSKKIIIVLSDGKILGDLMNLTYVLNMPQMKGVTRYSIGVGEGILSEPKAIQEMTQIADPEKFFKVSNYAALDDIQSSLEQSLIGAKGKKVFIKTFSVRLGRFQRP
uniref:Integrin, alpha E, tandem duplicate 1 n=1 Tax=Cyprinus carpio TaxID=7962 RepID=A0A8C2KKU8_CYPCA